VTLALCTDCRQEYPSTSLDGGRCWVCALRADPPRRLDGTEPPAPEPAFSYQLSRCLATDAPMPELPAARRMAYGCLGLAFLVALCLILLAASGR
jgi:hypothetical protein